MARPRAVRDPDMFAQRWRDLTVRVADIELEFGICEASVHITARRLGLPRRADLREQAGLCRQGPFARHLTREEKRMAHNKRQREWRRNRGIYQPRSTTRKDAPPAPTPTLFRCEYCGGPSTDAEGHSGCIARNQPKGRAA